MTRPAAPTRTPTPTATPTRDTRRRRLRAAGFAGLLLGCVALVEAKAATAPPVHHISLGSSLGTAPVPAGAAPPAPSAGTARRPASPAPGGVPAVPAVPRTVTGAPIDIGYGIVQVRLTLQGRRITDITTVQAPSDGRSAGIAAYAIPQLRREVLAAQSVNIDTVSGASYTSDGYARSVQSALDAARA